MKETLAIIRHDSPLLSKIKKYKKRAAEIKCYLDQHPDDWGRFQSEFNQEINGVFRDVMVYEKQCITDGEEDKIYRLKNLFIEKLRKDFIYGDCTRRSLEKPFGYAGDFKIIDDIYLNNPHTTGFDRLFDNYFHMSAASVATKNRKEDFKRIIARLIEQKVEREIRIMDLASGPCRDLKEIIEDSPVDYSQCFYDCYDNDPNAIEYAKKLLGKERNVNFFKQNVVKLALKKDVNKEIPCFYDLIFSTGLFDYLDERVSLRLISNLKKLLKPDGLMVISNYRDKYSNPSLHFMEWCGDWNLVYRTEEEFLKIFCEAGFLKSNLRMEYEQQGIMMYCFAKNNL